MIYENLVNRLRKAAGPAIDFPDTLYDEAADAIDELSRQRDRAYSRLCEWCGVCPEGKRNPEDCEIAALNPELPKDGGHDDV